MCLSHLIQLMLFGVVLLVFYPLMIYLCTFMLHLTFKCVIIILFESLFFRKSKNIFLGGSRNVTLLGLANSCDVK